MPEETITNENETTSPNGPEKESGPTEKPKKAKAEKQSKSVTDLLNEAFQDAKTEDRRREVLKALKAQKDAEELAAKVLG